MPNRILRRGAIQSPRHILAAAVPHTPLIAIPPTFLRKPQVLSMWGNDQFGDCVSAEEAFAKACSNPEIFIGDAEVEDWARNNGYIDGANLIDALQTMATSGFIQDGKMYCDGAPTSVNWTDSQILQSAIYSGPVKIGIAADQMETVVQNHGPGNGWYATGFKLDQNEDHCVSLCGYGTAGWLGQQLGATNIPPTEGTPAYAMFTWDSIGVISESSLIAICGEAWLRTPTTIVFPAS